MEVTLLMGTDKEILCGVKDASIIPIICNQLIIES